MMNLFRKYQKLFLGVITIFIIASFVFFGTYDAVLGRGEVAPDVPIGKAVDGSVMHQREIQNLIAMLDVDAQDVMVVEERARINLLNDGVLRNDILSSEIGKALFVAYLDDLRGDLGGRWGRFQAFKPYKHPSGSFGMEALWKQFTPSLANDYEKFKNIKEPLSLEGFEVLSNLYVGQVAFPSRLARQFLVYHQQQYGVGQDPYLNSGDLSLFYAKTASDWFGQRFVDLVAQFIHNIARYAKGKGYLVTYEEAKASLMQMGMENLERMERGRAISGDEFAKFFHQQVANLGMSEKEVVEAWQKVLLLRRLVVDVEQGLPIDASYYKEREKNAIKGVHVELYRLPKMYRGLSEEDLYKLDTYLRITDGATPEEVMKRRRDLVVNKYKVKFAHLEKKNLPSEVSLKRTWAWEIEDRNWKTLADSFSEVAKCKGKGEEERFAYLNSLSEKTRGEIDQFARQRIIDETPEFVYDKLDDAEGETETLRIARDEEIMPGIKDRAKLVALLEKEANFVYTEDKEHYYRFEVLERLGLEVVSFAEAKAALDKSDASAMVRLVALMERARRGDKVAVEKEEVKLTGADTHPILDETIFEKEEGCVSPTMMAKEGPYFYRVGKHFVDQGAITNAMKEAQEKLGKEAIGKLMQGLIQEIKTKKAIHFSGSEATTSN